MVQRVKLLAPSLTARGTRVMEEEQQLLLALLTLHKWDLNQKKRGHWRGGARLSAQSRGGGLEFAFQVNKGYIVKHCLKKKKKPPRREQPRVGA